MKIEIVVGANYGDEGKGLMTEYLCSQSPNSLVVMANGGSQRGHTVDDPKFGRYVFHHFGSGTFRGAKTYFPRKFLINPMQFVKEFGELKDLTGREPVSFRSTMCPLQLPGDIALNWHIEKCRGENRHGSVGCGIWETVSRVNRMTSAKKALTLSEFCELSYPQQEKYIKDCAYESAKIRLAEEKITVQPEIFDLFLNGGFIKHFVMDAKFMRDRCTVMPVVEFSSFDNIVLECGQGLLLDQYYNASREYDTTPSMTGAFGQVSFVNGLVDCVKNGPLNISYSSCRQIESITVNYVSRTYLTKHGPGIFSETSSNLIDKTNVWNEWQGNLRFGELMFDDLERRCLVDFENFKKFLDVKTIPVEMRTMFTHLDEFSLPLCVSPDFTCSTGKAEDVIQIK